VFGDLGDLGDPEDHIRGAKMRSPGYDPVGSDWIIKISKGEFMTRTVISLQLVLFSPLFRKYHTVIAAIQLVL